MSKLPITPNKPPLKSPDKSPDKSSGVKLIFVCILVLVMAIPAMFISYISFERSSRADDVTREVSQRYGGVQYLTGPMLVAPYYRLGSDETVIETGEYAISPEDGSIVFSDMSTTIKKRSLFKVPVYQAKGTMRADFAAIDPEHYTDRIIIWDKARLVIGLSDGRGLTEDIVLNLPNGTTRKFEPDSYGGGRGTDVPYAISDVMQRHGTLGGRVNSTFLSVSASDLVKTGAAFSVSTDIHIGGAQALGVFPFAKSTSLSMSSDWASPGFKGGFAPVEQDITETGFTARWSVPYLARGVRGEGPAHMLNLFNPSDKAMTVQFVAEVNPYQTVNRALKYSIMFIGLVFITFFLFEVLVGTPVHPAQYILIGLAQTIFYLLLLAFSEHIGFAGSFSVAAIATIALTSAYAGAVFGGRAYALRAGIVFGMTYGLLFVLMRLQDFALLIGALASFTAIALIMYLTRNIDWYGGDAKSPISTQ